MKPSPSAALAAPMLLWSSLAMKAMQTSTAAVEVIALRTRRLAAAGALPGADDQRELALMGAEKVDAFSRAAQSLAHGAIPLVAGMAGQTVRSSLELATAATRLAASRTLPQTLERQRAFARVLMRHAPPADGGASAAARLAHRALAPVHATATANARRLRGESE